MAHSFCPPPVVSRALITAIRRALRPSVARLVVAPFFLDYSPVHLHAFFLPLCALLCALAVACFVPGVRRASRRVLLFSRLAGRLFAVAECLVVLPSR